MDWKVSLFEIHNDDEDVSAVSKVIRRGSHWAAGSEIEEFELAVANSVGRKYAVTFNSGTSAMQALLFAHGISDGEVIVPSFVFISTVNNVMLSGAKVVFGEIESETLGLDFDDVKERVTDDTKAIILMHYAGMPARDTEKFVEFCNEKNILLIEDAAEAHGAKSNGTCVGAFGSEAMLSFCQNKIVPVGEGGAVVTDSAEIYELLKLIRSHGRKDVDGVNFFSSVKDSDYVALGYNYRLPTISAALGLSQLNKMQNMIRARRKHAVRYFEAFKNIDAITCLTPNKGMEYVYQMYTILLDNNKHRDELQDFLKKRGIMTKIYFEPAHLKTFYRKKGFSKGDFPVTEDLSGRVLTLPMYVDLSEEDHSLIISSVQEFFGK
tara:strand:+ start:43 stop:1179 length:1137 start_codon:yes stop_codon:yes gene_type:complete